MAKTKKIISVVLALVMVLSSSVLYAWAWTGVGTEEVKLTATADKNVVSPGDVVTVSFSVDKSDAGTWVNAFAGYTMTWFYNSKEIEPVDISYSDTYLNFSSKKPISKFPSTHNFFKSSVAKSTPDEQARIEKNGYDYMVKMQCAKDKTTSLGEQGYWTIDQSNLQLFSINFKVSESAVPGSKICLDLTTGLINFGQSYMSIVPGFESGNIGAKMMKDAQYYDFSDASVELTVASPAPAGPVVSKAKSQVKMTATSANTVADEFSFRVISKISDSDWDTYFKNTGVADATTDYITAVGMVAYKGAAAFDADTAKRVVAGESVADYTAATTDYISKVNDTADAEFGAIIKANHSTLNNDVTYMGFVQYVDASGNAQTIFYETAETAALSTNYNNIVSAYLARYPFAA